LSQDMDHGYFKNLLSGYLDGELTDEQQVAIRQHLQECDVCSSELSRLRKLDELVQKHSQLDGRDYWEESAQKIERTLGIASTEVTDMKKEKTRRGLGWGWRLTGIAASVLIVGYIGWHQSDTFRDEVTIPPASRQSEMVSPAPPDTTIHKVISDNRATPSEEATAGPAKGRGVRTPSVEPEGDIVEGIEPNEPDTKAARIGVPVPVSDEIDVDRSQEVVVPAAAVELNEYVPTESKSRGRREAKTAGAVPETAEDASGDFRDVSGTVVQVGKAEDEETPVLLTEESRVYSGSDTEELAASELVYWRARRDTLLEHPQREETQDYLNSIIEKKPEASAMPKLGLDALSLPKSSDREEWEARLLEAWHGICLFSSDSTEVKTGLEFLRSVASDSSSVNSQKARDYLRKLGRL